MSARWNPIPMLSRARTLFLNKVYARKKLAHANHEVHHLFRTQETWLPERIASVCSGTYYPRPLTCYYFQDDIVLFCQTKRQLKRAKRLVQQVLQERQLRLSRTKSRCGRVDEGFHFTVLDQKNLTPAPLLKPRVHARTLRNAREQVRSLLTSRLSAETAATYLSHPPSLKLWRTRWAINIDDFVVSCPA